MLASAFNKGIRVKISGSVALILLAPCPVAMAQPAPMTTADAARIFGAREAIGAASLSPDGTKIAFIGPGAGQTTTLYAIDTSKESSPHVVTKTSGDPERLYYCLWVSNDRLSCTIGGLQLYNGEIFGFSSTIAINADGTNMKLLSKRQGENAHYGDFRGGSVIDYVPDADGVVMMMRAYVPESKVGSLIESKLQGMGVDRIDTRTLDTKRIENPRADAVEYITDGNGNVRIAGYSKANAAGYDKGQISYSYRLKNSRDWKSLSVLDYITNAGFNPYIVDAAKDVVYGFNKVGGRKALVSISLADQSLKQDVVVARSDVDVDGLIQIGKRRRVVGASYATERRQSVYFDPELKKLAGALGKALPNQPLIEFVDASLDEKKLLLWAGGDTSAGTYYLFDKATKKLQPIMPTRPELANVALANVQSVSYPATDGTGIPGYLTLPPGSSGKNLPTIVMPHGGPSSRDEWGFDWLAQFYANRGYAVLQPNYRGSSGYGDSWYQQNGYKSWRTAIGDVNDAGRWLAKSGVADPKRLFIVGWSYGGYAALQSAVLEPGLFKAVVAVAPVTDLELYKAEYRNFSARRVSENFVGSGPHIKEGSPAQNADRITVPVLMFHGAMDRNVRIAQSRFMAKQLKAAGKQVELIEYPKLEHSLVDGAVRAEVLRRSAEFLQASGGK
jgi:dipeptidyl aminopeptidase/acylaminoacyl peptidase